MKVLIGCENSGIIRDAFLARGHDTVSCDLLPSDRPGPHYQGDVRDLLGPGVWDLFICHPDCTYLCSSGLHWNKRRPERAALTEAALDFVREMMAAPVPRKAIENPVGRINTAIRPPDQYIQPWQFGHDASKKTGLWLENLPELRPTQLIEPRWVCCGVVLEDYYGCPNCCGDKKPLPRWGNQTNSGQNKLPPSKDRWKLRAETYQGWADAMADQWGHAMTRQVYATPFDPETLQPTGPSVPTGFGSMDEAVNATGQNWTRRRDGMVIYPGGLCLSYAIIHIDRPGNNE